MTLEEQVIRAFSSWYSGLTHRRGSGGPARGTIAAALVVLERLKKTFDPNLDSHRALGGSQIRGVSGPAVSTILATFGETRRFLSEGGRTNRGVPGDIGKMLQALKASPLKDFSAVKRTEVLTELQRFLVGKIQAFHAQQRIKIVYDPAQTTWQTIHDLLNIARETGKEGPVAQYLVGAKLQIRFSGVNIENKSYSTADHQLGRPGDFRVGDTAFHVTVSPMLGVYDKCKRNIEEGLRVYLLVPDSDLSGARQNAAATSKGRISVESIESFVAQNIEEFSA